MHPIRPLQYAAALACAFGAATAVAQQPRIAPPQSAAAPPAADGPLLRLDAHATREVTDDTAVAIFFVERDGAQPAALQSGVNAVLQSALADLKRDAALQVRSGAYTTQPRTGRDGRIESWRVRAELVAEAADMSAISRASATLSGRMNVGSIGFRLSSARRTETENALTAEVAERLYARARAAALALGYPQVELVEASLGAGAPPVTFVRAAMARGELAADATPVPIEPGRSQVTVTIAGVLRMKRP